jgi:hypothetical protein
MSPSRALSRNPFLSSVFGSALDQNPADVGEINAAAFEKCRSLIADVREQNLTQALLLFGEPGSGKTHLLSRLRASLEEEERAGRVSLFVPIRMVTSAAMLWRFLRRQLADALLRQRSDNTRPLANVIRRSREEMSGQDRNLGIVLGNLLEGVHFVDSAAWLRGDDLPEEAAKALGVSSLSDEEEQEAASRRIITTICALGEPVPFVFCLDQLEALQSFPGDTAGFFKLGQAVSHLHDSTHNAAVFSCLQTSMLPELEAAVRAADYDRMLRRRAALMPLNLGQAMKLIDARLETAPGLKEQQPISEAGIKDLFQADGLCVARKVIVRCQELFDAWSQKAPEPVETLENALDRKYQLRRRATPVEDTEGILRTALPAMLHLRGIKLRDGTVSGKRPAALAICNQKAGAVLIRRLEKAQSEWQASGEPRLLILRDARNGIGVGAKKTRERVAELEKAGARLLPVTPEALAALEAISSLLADARSGDLTPQLNNG